MKLRIRAAWNCLRGRPTLAFWDSTIHLARPLHISPTGAVQRLDNERKRLELMADKPMGGVIG